tara:strand:+ start:623 stop:1084 length:462 start_codon:yes stop_codon:yes gene_type:complete
MVNIEIQVKGLKGNIDKLEDYMEDDSLVGIMFGYFDINEPEEADIQYKGNKILMSYSDDEDPMGQFKKIKSFCADYTKFSRFTSKAIMQHIKQGGGIDDFEGVGDRGPVDPYFMGAVQSGKFGDPKRPFTYTASMKRVRESVKSFRQFNSENV